MTHCVSWGVWEKSEKSVPELSRGPNPSSGGGRFQNLKLEWVPYFSSDFLSTSSKAVDVVDRRRSSSIIVVVIAANLCDFLSVVRLVARRSARQNRAETAGLRTPPHPDRGVYRYDLPLRDATEFGRGRIGRSWTPSSWLRPRPEGSTGRPRRPRPRSKPRPALGRGRETRGRETDDRSYLLSYRRSA